MAANDRTSVSQIAELRRQLRSDETTLVDKYAIRIDAIEGARPWFVAGAVVGAVMTGSARIIAGTVGISITIIGVALTAIFGVLVGWADYRKLELSREARSAMKIADDALVKAEEFAVDLDYQLQLADQRSKRLATNDLVLEQSGAMIAQGLGTGDSLDAILDTVKFLLVGACGFEASEYWAVTVFSLDEDERCMEKIAALWNDQTTSARASRSWKRGQGFTGVAWRNESPVVVPDVTLPGVAQLHPVPADLHRAHDSVRYRSAASYPVIVDGKVWGVVTATSDRAGRFDLSNAIGLEVCWAVRDIAAHAALLASVERYAAENEA